MTASVPLIDEVAFNLRYGDVDGHARLVKVVAIFDTYCLKWQEYAATSLERGDIVVMLDIVQGMCRFASLFHANKVVSLSNRLVNVLNNGHLDTSLFNELTVCIHDTQCLLKKWVGQGLLHFDESSVIN